MAEVVRVCGIAKERIASICNVSRINRIISIDFLVIVFGVVMSFLIPEEMEPSDGYIVVGDTVVSQDANTWIATKSLAHAEGKQLVSGVPEVVQVSGELENLSSVSTTGFDTSSAVEVGDEIEADTGSSSVASVSGGGATTVETSQAGGSNSFGATFMNNNYPLPNGEKIKALGLKSSSAQTGFLFVYRQDSATEYTCVARVVLTHSGSNLFEYADLDTPFNVPSTGTFYIAGSSFDTAGAYMYDTSALRANPVDAAVGETLTFAATTVAPVTGYQYEGECTVTVNPPFSDVPTKIFKKPAGLALKLGAGAVGEYMGPEVPLAWGTGSNTYDLVFESTEPLAEKIIKSDGPPVGGTGADLIPSFVSASYDEETQTSTVDGWEISQDAVINQNYPFYKTRQNDDTTVVPGYLPSWATGSASGHGFITAPQPVVVGALVLGGGIPGGLNASPPEHIFLEGFNGSSWDVLVDTTETRWTSDWQDFEYPVSNTNAYTEFRFAMDRDRVLHKFQFKEASERTYTADPNALHNDVAIDDTHYKVSQVLEKESSAGSFIEQEGGAESYSTDTNLWVNKDVIIPAGATVTALGNDSNLTTTLSLLIFKELSSTELEVVAIASGTNSTTGVGYQYFDLDTPFTVPHDSSNYLIGVIVESGGSFGRNTTGVSGYYAARSGSYSVGDTVTVSANTVQPLVGARASSSSYTTTATLVNPLPQAPTGTESICIPSRLLDLECAISAEVVPAGLKLTGEKIIFEDNPDIKAMCMAVKAPAETVLRDFKITPERMG